jgi:hypothetical protein
VTPSISGSLWSASGETHNRFHSKTTLVAQPEHDLLKRSRAPAGLVPNILGTAICQCGSVVKQITSLSPILEILGTMDVMEGRVPESGLEIHNFLLEVEVEHILSNITKIEHGPLFHGSLEGSRWGARVFLPSRERHYY